MAQLSFPDSPVLHRNWSSMTLGNRVLRFWRLSGRLGVGAFGGTWEQTRNVGLEGASFQMQYRKLQVINPSFQDSALLGLKPPRESQLGPFERLFIFLLPHCLLCSTNRIRSSTERKLLPSVFQQYSQQTDLKEYACAWKQSFPGVFLLCSGVLKRWSQSLC